ncbi:hypothetical protein MFLAVUS_004177 [Mucor flavus]|uniref:Uncharacterized protein n=1 Tax=Mucor flavus TaxID=439312 RepID=A0ABP9YV74_9FUNG
MPPRLQPYSPGVQVYERDRVFGTAHLHTLRATVLLDMSIGVYVGAGGTFPNPGQIDLFNICLEITASGRNQTLIRDDDQNFPSLFPRSTIIVDSLTIERRIEPVPSSFGLLEILVLSPAHASRSIFSTGLEPVNVFDPLSINASEGSGSGTTLARGAPQGTPTTSGEPAPSSEPSAER